MALETATYISDLVAANPTASDAKSQGDDHLRLVKSALKATLPNLTGAMTATHLQLNQIVTAVAVNAAAGAGSVVVDASGNVAVGTNSPSTYGRFVVAGTGAVQSWALADSASNASYRGFAMGQTGSAQQYGSLSMELTGGEMRLTSGYGGFGGFQTFYTNGVERMRIDAIGNVIPVVQVTPPTLATNQQMAFNLTSNTNLRISVRGTDGTTRTVNLALA